MAANGHISARERPALQSMVMTMILRTPEMMEAVDAQRFAQHVRRTLGALYDYPRLQASPLARLLVSDLPESARGPALHQMLAKAIERLRPTSVEAGAPSFRRHQYLHLRYVDVRGIAEVAATLGVSLRQARRDHHEAVNVLASRLYEDYRAFHSAHPRGNALVPPSADPALDAEVERLGLTSRSEATDCDEVIASVVETLQPLAQSRGVLVRHHPMAVRSRTPLDRAVVRQILISAVGYAVTSVQSDTVELRGVGTHHRVELTVRFPAAVLPREEAEAARRLGVCRHFLALVHGTLSVVARQGVVELALSLPALLPAIILVVDDNADTRLLFRRYLAGGPYRIVEAGGYEEALEVARSVAPQVIIIDVMLPGHDGWELLQRLKQEAQGAVTPVIVCSALRERELALALGAADVLEKPVTPEALLAAIAQQLYR